MRTSVFIVSFHRDVEFLRYCLLSIRKFASGFDEVVVAAPFQDAHLFNFVDDLGARLVRFEETHGKGMMCHELQIVSADIWCPRAEAIVFVDSDCMFWEPVTPADYFVDGKPVLYRERYATLTNKLRLNWKAAVKKATGIDPEWETMIRHPAVHLPATLAKTRALIVEHTGKSSAEYILGCESAFPQSFAEFPALGGVAIEHFYDRYHFVEFDVRTPDGGYEYQRGRDFLKAFWSHAGVDVYRREMDAILQ